MAGSSPSPRQSQQWQPQQPSVLAQLLSDDRNSESRHKFLIESAKRESDRVREEAERVAEIHKKKVEQQQLLEARRKEEARIKLEEAVAAERLRVLALEAKTVEIPPLPPAPEPTKSLPPRTNVTASVVPGTNDTGPKTQEVNGTTKSPAISKPSTVSNLFSGPRAIVSPEPTSAPPAPTAPNGIPSGFNPFAKPLATDERKQSTSPATSIPIPSPPTAASSPTVLVRYATIHKNLKALRKSIAEQSTTNPALKARVGDMRREIRKKLGQLSVGGKPGANKQQLQAIINYAIGQFINESGPRPETADPVGVCLATVFSEPDFLWRGESLIDILMAKFGVVCPVLFGRTGKDVDPREKLLLGWWRQSKGGPLVPEQIHADRMTGLGAGFAAVSLRKFGNSKKTNPYPPRHYWAAMARIVNTPPERISATQCVVLKSMIENYAQKFIEFYGTAAVAALRLCLVDFPARAPEKSAAAESLNVLAQVLKRDMGLAL
ncbi:hypothetical protein OQA88_6855 [Cercophora sp. LCS_1]